MLLRFARLIYLSLLVIGTPLFAQASELLMPPTETAPFGRYFKDVLDAYPYVESIHDLKIKGAIAGYPDGNFGPDQSISRAEFITMVMASVSKNLKGGHCFKDVRDEWFAKFVCSARSRGFVKGFEDGSFQPDRNISLAEASVVLAKTYRLKLPKKSARDPWYKPSIKALSKSAAIPASLDTVDALLSRGETAEILWRLKSKDKTKTSKSFESLAAPFPKIESCAELQEKFAFAAWRGSGRFYPIMMMAKGGEGDGAESMSLAPSFSSTNVQVEGVDEGDIVKNDGEFIYLIHGNVLKIMKAYPPEQMEVIKVHYFDPKTIEASDLYISGKKIVIVGSRFSEGDQTVAQIYSFSPDQKNLTLERSIIFDGTQVSSRRIGNRLFLILNDLALPNRDMPMPFFEDSLGGKKEPVTECEDVNFIPRFEDFTYTVIAGIDIEDTEKPISREVVLGASDTVYASGESIYVAGIHYEFPVFGRFLFTTQFEDQKTLFFRFALEPSGNIVFKTKGEVPGHLLNQFSMDENSDSLRVATTTGNAWGPTNLSKNNLYILDRNDLAKIKGKLEGLAPGEQIYSVRFIGKRAYLVTFKKIDPFFVIDLSDETNPRVLGALKIPGFSNYLHPFDENHIIGFGKEAVDPQELSDEGLTSPGFNFAWYQGMKIALFDVADTANPKVLFKEVIGDRGTDSELLYNHKALLFDRERKLFAFPVNVSEIPNKEKGKYTGSEYGETVFRGAYVYTLDLQTGFQLLGKPTHDPDVISRIVRIGETLYTISPEMVKAFSFPELSELNVKAFPEDKPEPDE